MATQDQNQTSTQQKSTLNFSSVMIGTAQLQVVAAFYQKLFNRAADMQDESYIAWKVGRGFLAGLLQLWAGGLTGTRGALCASWGGEMDRTLRPVFSLRHHDGQQVHDVPITKPST